MAYELFAMKKEITQDQGISFCIVCEYKSVKIYFPYKSFSVLNKSSPFRFLATTLPSESSR